MRSIVDDDSVEWCVSLSVCHAVALCQNEQSAIRGDCKGLNAHILDGGPYTLRWWVFDAAFAKLL